MSMDGGSSLAPGDTSTGLFLISQNIVLPNCDLGVRVLIGIQSVTISIRVPGVVDAEPQNYSKKKGNLETNETYPPG